MQGKVLICKMVVCKEQEWASIVRDEISVMMLNEGDSLIKCYDSFDWNGKLWIILESMGGDVQKLLGFFRENDIAVSENVIRYVLYRTL